MPQDVSDCLRRADLKPLLDRINTSVLQQGAAPTKALVVFNRGAAPVSGIAVFPARFPVRAAAGPQPVTVRDVSGRVIPSQITNESWTELPHLPEKRLWEFDLRLYTEDVPALGWRAYAAIYGFAPESAGDPALWRETDSTMLLVGETNCHAGDLPPTFSALSTVPSVGSIRNER